MHPSMLLGLAHGAVSVLGFPLSGTNPSHPSPTSPLTHHLYPPSKPRLLTHGWPSTLPLPVYNPTPTEPAYPPTTPSPPSSIHFWMVRTCLLLMQPILPSPPPTTHCSLGTRPASFLHPSSTSNVHPKYRLLSPPLSPPSPFWMSINPSDTGKARLLDGSTQHGPSAWHVRIPMAERFRYFEQGTDPISSARAADLLACPPHLVDKNCLSWHPSNHVSTVYPSEPMRVTSCTAVKGSVFMVPSAGAMV